MAIGTGTDVAIESSDITLISGDLDGVVTAIALSRATMRNIRQNLVFAFGYNTIGIPIAAGALYPAFGLLLSPMIAAAAMALSSLSVVGNANRLRRFRTPPLGGTQPAGAMGMAVGVEQHPTSKETDMFKGKKTSKVKAPVCGMSVDPDKAAAQVVHQGQTYYFCSPSCRDQFAANPGAYL